MILNGRAALTAGKNDYTSEDEDDEKTHTFRKNSDKEDHMKIILESMSRQLTRSGYRFFWPLLRLSWVVSDPRHVKTLNYR